MAKSVLIVGAGPGGATIAYLLARNGVEVTLLERHTDFAREFRGEVVFAGGQQAFDQMGLWSKFEDVPQVELTAFHVHIGGRERRLALSESAFGRFRPRWVSQPSLLEMLVTEASAHAGFRIERGVTVRDLIRQGDRIVGVVGSDHDGEREWRADLIVGADGRASVVRARADIETVATDLPMDILWCKLPLPPSFRAEPALHAYVERAHLLIAAPIYDGNMQFGWVIPKGSYGELKERGVSEWIAELARRTTGELSAHLEAHKADALHPFLLSTLSNHVHRWSKPGLLLIGDAAHTMSPVGAQGINIAIRDAVVAANHLVSVLKAGRAEDLDDASNRVEQERRPEIVEIQRLQAIPPPVLFGQVWWSPLFFALVPPLLPILPNLDPTRTPFFRRFAFGITDVNLTV